MSRPAGAGFASGRFWDEDQRNDRTPEIPRETQIAAVSRLMQCDALDLAAMLFAPARGPRA